MSNKIVAWGAISLFLMLIFACEGGSPGDAQRQGIDVGAERASLIQADLDFAELAASAGLAEAYKQYLAEDAVQLPDGDLPIAGRQAIYENIVLAIQSNEFLLTWEPIAAEVSASGDLGYTWGAYFFEAEDEAGEPFSYEGKYVNIWSKRADGSWEIVLDISNQNLVEYYDDLDQGLIEPDSASNSVDTLENIEQ